MCQAGTVKSLTAKVDTYLQPVGKGKKKKNQQKQSFKDAELSPIEALALEKSVLHLLFWPELQFPLQAQSKSSPLQSTSSPPIYRSAAQVGEK